MFFLYNVFASMNRLVSVNVKVTTRDNFDDEGADRDAPYSHDNLYWISYYIYCGH